ncbi:MAG: hypothetical protein IT435_02280 [Phycisphaerales bacterium]|nr:hypothetical protein [Phycisphaerales bacterium]
MTTTGSVVLHLMGPTCAGKSTLIQRLTQIAPKTVHAVEVGRMLREKYGEPHFAGQAAPTHTQGEAWRMYTEGTKEGIAKGRQIILVDGQPRDAQQARDAIGAWRFPHRSEFLLIHADHDTREFRARKGRKGDSLELALQRMNNDYRNCYVVMTELCKQSIPIRVFDTSLELRVDGLAERILAEYARE